MIIAYKMARKKNGFYYPMYVDSKYPFEMNKWNKAKNGEMTKDGKVKSKLGKLHYRPGFHCSDIPYETHIGKRGDDGSIAFFPKDVVWLEVLVWDEINYQCEANANGVHKNGKFVARDADLDHIPENGFYKYKTNPAAYAEWIICDLIYPIRELSDREVKELCTKENLTPLPREGEIA